jgi:hypothetical protein
MKQKLTKTAALAVLKPVSSKRDKKSFQRKLI